MIVAALDDEATVGVIKDEVPLQVLTPQAHWMPSPPDRYGARPAISRPERWWREKAEEVLLLMLDAHHAVTATEMEARAEDRTFDTNLCPKPIDPHWLGNARRELKDDGSAAWPR